MTKKLGASKESSPDPRIRLQTNLPPNGGQALKSIGLAVLAFAAVSGFLYWQLRPANHDEVQQAMQDPSEVNETISSSAPSLQNPSLAETACAPIPIEAAIQENGELASLNPLEDGWETEFINDIAGAQLKALGNQLFESDLSPAKLEEFLTEDCAISELRPAADRETVAFDENGIRVARLKLVDSVTTAPSTAELTYRGKTAVAEALVKLVSTFQQAKDVHAKFKIVQVDAGTESAVTEQFVDFHGQTEQGMIEQHATWRTEWVRSKNSSAPLIRSIELLDFEETISSTGGRLFSDCTQSVFQHEPKILVEQLSVGLAGWIRRLEHYLKTYQFGHNGLAIGDINNDGLDDLYLCQTGGLPNRLFLHQADGTLRDVSREAGVDFLDDTRAALFVDLDNDGDQDLVLALPSELLLLGNDGRGNFELKARREEAKGAFSLAAADYDRDGQLDLYACIYFALGEKADELPIPMPFYDATNGGKNIMLRNEGDWQFSDVTESSGLDADNSRFSYAAVWEDYDNDGDQDLFVANDFGRNNLYRNENGKFSEVTEEVGMLDNTFGMSAAAADFNRDGWIDFYKANMFSSAGSRVTRQSQFMPEASAQHKQKFQHLARGNTLFENHEGQFRDTSVERGVTMGRWSWGSIFMDFNNDGWEDIFVANGFVTGQVPDDL